MDWSKLVGLDKEYQTVLKKYQQFTDMSDDRIEKLVDGIRIRMKEFNIYKEKQISNGKSIVAGKG